jgi:hypothetical protein
MSEEYVLFMRSEAVEFYRSLRRAEKGPLAQFFDLLENFPTLTGETTEQDGTGRTVQVKFVGKFKVVYWADHPVKEIKTLKLDRLPKR